MKKLMSVLLVAVLLISAVPFAASATVWEDNSADNGISALNDDGVVVYDGTSNESRPGTQVILVFDGVQDDNHWANISGETNVKDVLSNFYTTAELNELMTKYSCSTSYGDWYAVVPTGISVLTVNFTTNKFAVNVGFNGESASWYKDVKYGETITLNKDLISAAGLSLGADYDIDFFKVGNKDYKVGEKVTITGATTITVVKKAAGSNSTAPTTPSTTATYVSVILVTDKTTGFKDGEYINCTLVDGKISTADRDKVAKLVAGKNIVAWKRGDNGTQASTLLNFDFSKLEAPINIYPVVGTTDSNNGSTNTNGKYTLTFKSDSNTVLYTINNVNGKLTDDQKAIVNLAAKAVPAVSGGTFNGMWQVNGGATSNVATSTITDLMSFDKDYVFVAVYTKNTSSDVTSKKDLNDIILNIFVNKDFNNCKTIKLNGYSILDDDKITLNEIMNSVVTTYYKATDSNKGLQGDGLYYTTGSFMYNWLTDAKKVDAIDDIAAKRAEGTVTINIMVTNATAKSSTTTADSSNPKTGDSIYTAMTVMGISAATLAAVMYVYNKKRQAI